MKYILLIKSIDYIYINFCTYNIRFIRFFLILFENLNKRHILLYLLSLNKY